MIYAYFKEESGNPIMAVRLHRSDPELLEQKGYTRATSLDRLLTLIRDHIERNRRAGREPKIHLITSYGSDLFDQMIDPLIQRIRRAGVEVLQSGM
jgi:hypothetical protein